MKRGDILPDSVFVYTGIFRYDAGSAVHAEFSVELPVVICNRAWRDIEDSRNFLVRFTPDQQPEYFRFAVRKLVLFPHCFNAHAQSALGTVQMSRVLQFLQQLVESSAYLTDMGASEHLLTGKNRADACQQLTGVEGFRDILNCSVFNALQFLLESIPGCQKHEGYSG